MSEHAEDTARPVSAVITQQLLGYVARVAGEAAVAEVLDEAGLAGRAGELADPSGWCTAPDALRLAAAAARRCGDPDIGRRTGEQLFLAHKQMGLTEFHTAAGSVVDAIAVAVDYGSRMGVGRRSAMTVVEEGRVVVETTYADPGTDPASRFFCAVTTGYYAMLPTTFGADAATAETSCVHTGDDRCVMQIVWEGAHAVAEATKAQSSAAVDDGINRYENLQKMAADLASEQDISGLLDKVVRRAGTAALAVRTLLAVHLPGEAHLRVHHTGFATDTDAATAARQLLEGDVGDSWGYALVAPVASSRHDYGKLVVFLSPDASDSSGGTVDEAIRRMVLAYAGHATAAIDAAVALAGARRDRETAEALLGLARALAEVGDIEETARRVASVVRQLTGSDQAAVAIHDPDSGELVMRAWSPPTLPFEGVRFDLDAIPELARLVASHDPVSVPLAHATPALASAMRSAGNVHLLAVPVVAGGSLAGVIMAGYVEGQPPLGDALADRLRGLADHAAAALENSRLLEQVRHQALHDPLTGLPNRALAEDRANHALVQARRTWSTVGLLFIDLDGFKAVNDTLGHAVGDELLVQVADRLRGCMRASDTIARLGGDEFLVVLHGIPQPEAATAAAAKVHAELRRPFEIAGEERRISGSIGIACAPFDGDDYDQLLLRADTAMYAAKDAGRDQVVRYAARNGGPTVTPPVTPP